MRPNATPPDAVAHPFSRQGRPDSTSDPRSALTGLCAAGFVAYCSYAIFRAPLLPLFASELGAGPSLIGLVVGPQP